MDIAALELIKTWTDPDGQGFVLQIFDTRSTDHLGKSRLAYRFLHNDKLIFEGDDFCASPMNSIDGLQTVAALLSFLSLQDGDTDEEYFDSYTPEQIEWRDAYAEDLSLYPMLIEEGKLEED